MWIYEQKTGRLYHDDVLITSGYSGFAQGKNDPNSQHVPGIGPLPRGAYLVGTVDADVTKHGPVALHLVPIPPTQTFSRSGFMVHGDSKENPGAASHGCIIVGRPMREAMRDGYDRLLIVLSGNRPLQP